MDTTQRACRDLTGPTPITPVAQRRFPAERRGAKRGAGGEAAAYIKSRARGGESGSYLLSAGLPVPLPPPDTLPYVPRSTVTSALRRRRGAHWPAAAPPSAAARPSSDPGGTRPSTGFPATFWFGFHSPFLTPPPRPAPPRPVPCPPRPAPCRPLPAPARRVRAKLRALPSAFVAPPHPGAACPLSLWALAGRL